MGSTVVPDDEVGAGIAAWWSDPRRHMPATVPVRPPGLHRADGLSGPPRRYLAIVVLLAGTASLPLVTAVLTGPGSRGDTAFAGASPFLAPPSGGPVVISPSVATRTGRPLAIPPEYARPADASRRAQTVVRRSPATDRLSAASARWVAPAPSPPTAQSEQPGTYQRPFPVRLPWASPAPARSPTASPAPAPSPTASPTRSPTPTHSPQPSPTPTRLPEPSDTPDARPTPNPTLTPDPIVTPDPSPSPTLEPSPTMPTFEPPPS
jgi:hypothetical protein